MDVTGIFVILVVLGFLVVFVKHFRASKLKQPEESGVSGGDQPDDSVVRNKD